MSQRVEGHVRTQRRVVLRHLPLVRHQVRVHLHHAVAHHHATVLIHRLVAVPHRNVVGRHPGVVLLRPNDVHRSNDQANVALQRLRRSVQLQSEHVDQHRKVVQQTVSSNPLFPSWLAIPGVISARPLRVKSPQIFAVAKFLPKKPTVV